MIEESSSPFGAPYKREDGKRTRLCCDFREINKIVVGTSRKSFDINSAFWSIPIREGDRDKTAFATQRGHYQWKVLPFGLKISPTIF